MLIESHEINRAKQHSELLYQASNGQFKSKMDLPLEKVAKITPASPTILPKLSKTCHELLRNPLDVGGLITICHHFRGMKKIVWCDQRDGVFYKFPPTL